MKQEDGFASTESECESEMQSGSGLSATRKCLISCATACVQVWLVTIKGSDDENHNQVHSSFSLPHLHEKPRRSTNDLADSGTLLVCPWIWIPNTNSSVLLLFFFNLNCGANLFSVGFVRDRNVTLQSVVSVSVEREIISNVEVRSHFKWTFTKTRTIFNAGKKLYKWQSSTKVDVVEESTVKV